MIDDDADLPVELQHPRFTATPLTADVAALDYAAYMASPDVIRAHSDGRWPLEGFTLSDDLELVAQHQADHASRRAFTFVLLAPSRAEALGCVYLNSLPGYLQRAGAATELLDRVPRPSAMVTFWIRQDLLDTGLPEAVAEAVDEWLLTAWPFAMHLFRVLPAEVSSVRALDRLPLPQTRLELAAEERPFLWYGMFRAPRTPAAR